MILFSLNYLPDHNAIVIKATVGEESGNIAFDFLEDKEKFVRALEISLNNLMNEKRVDVTPCELIYKEPLSKGLKS
jgi:hypothetical protein